MPELPEVAGMLSRLAPAVVGREVQALKAVTEQARSLLHGNIELLCAGAKLVSLGRHGKVSLFFFDSGAVIAIQLGMSGRLALRAPAGRHDHIALYLSGDRILTYADHRRFGGVYVRAETELRRCPPLAGLGPDALDSTLDERVLPAGRRTIKDVLLDQRVIAGLGNIYVCETLFRAGIDPRRPCSKITLRERRLLVMTIQDLLAEAVANGGATLDDYRGTEGEAGTFDAKFAVYGRDGLPCPGCTCGGAVVRIRQGGRSTWLCKARQA